MSKKPFPIESRLLLSISKHGGTATLTQIRLDCYGRLTSAALERARVGLADLVVSEKSRSKGSKRPTTRLSLTLRGWAAVQHLRPGWQPRRLAVDVLKAWLAELQAERVPWAVGFIRDAEDAYRWRRHESEVKDKKRRCKLRTLRRPRSSRPIMNAIPGSPISAPIPTSVAGNSGVGFDDASRPAPDSVLSPGGFCERCHANSELCRCPNPIPGRSHTPTIRTHDSGVSDGPTGDSIERIKEKARRLGYGAAIMQDGMRYDSRKISFQEWDAKVSE